MIQFTTEARQELPTSQIAAFNAQYFNFVEGNILCKTTRFTDSLFLIFASYYIFNLKYPSQVKKVFVFSR